MTSGQRIADSNGVIPPESTWVTERRRNRGRRATDCPLHAQRSTTAPSVDGSAFGRRLRELRDEHGLSLRALAAKVYRDSETSSRYDPTTLGRYERGSLPPTSNCAEDCDRVLNTGGQLLELWNQARASISAAPHDRAPQLGGELLRLVDLPAGPARLAGHGPALAALDQALHDLETAHKAGAVAGPAVIGLDGAPGIGKTTLALHWAHRVQKRFGGGAVFADLGHGGADGAPMSTHDALGALLQFVVSVPPPSATRDQLRLWRTVATEGAPMLIVLDDAASAEQIAPLIAGSPGSLILITSRTRLCSLSPRPWRRITLAPLADAAALEVIRDVAGPIAGTHRAAVARILAACAGSPRALEKVADRLAQAPEQPVAALLEGIATPAARDDR